MGVAGAHNFSAAKSPNQSHYSNNNGVGRDFSENHEMSYGNTRHRMANRGGPGARSQNASLESKERSQLSGNNDQILRNNEILLLSAKKENQIHNNLKKELDEK